MSEVSGRQKQVKDLKITVVIAILLAVMQQFSGINAIVVYGTKIAESAVSGELKLLIPSLINLDQVITTFFTSYLLSKYGRRSLLLMGGLLISLACAVVMVGFFLKDHY